MHAHQRKVSWEKACLVITCSEREYSSASTLKRIWNCCFHHPNHSSWSILTRPHSQSHTQCNQRTNMGQSTTPLGKDNSSHRNDDLDPHSLSLAWNCSLQSQHSPIHSSQSISIHSRKRNSDLQLSVASTVRIESNPIQSNQTHSHHCQRWFQSQWSQASSSRWYSKQ